MHRFSKILLVSSDEPGEESVFRRAVELARNNQAVLTVVGLSEGMGLLPAALAGSGHQQELLAALEQRKRAALEELLAPWLPPDMTPTIRVLYGTPFLAIIREVLREGHDLVIKAAECQSPLEEIFLGSTDMHLLRKCPTPVWIMRPGRYTTYHRILAAVDPDPDGGHESEALDRLILELATSQALAQGGELHVVHAWRLVEEESAFYRVAGVTREELDLWGDRAYDAHRSALHALMAAHRARIGEEAVDYLHPRLHLVKGDPRRAIPRLAHQLGADLIVMGTVVRTGIPGLCMGNTAETILGRIACSVLTVKPPGFTSPVILEDAAPARGG